MSYDDRLVATMSQVLWIGICHVFHACYSVVDHYELFAVRFNSSVNYLHCFDSAGWVVDRKDILSAKSICFRSPRVLTVND